MITTFIWQIDVPEGLNHELKRFLATTKRYKDDNDFICEAIREKLEKLYALKQEFRTES